MSTNSNIDEIDLAITTRIYVDPPGVAGTEIYMRARLTEEAKARVQQELLKARIAELEEWIEEYSQAYVEYKHTGTDDKGMILTPTKTETYISLFSIQERLSDLQTKLKENSDE